ncbi:unnamed protein product [Adineta steineri]|uniref:Peptidase S9 prolyl oligopeptidase catalytic domain-containing protein n=2 Tax=Adineta steineri TaxID=433720 RepID=A0A814SUY3_9BILA|nr:unnamed protein product [Adineta steineri]
MPGSNTDYLTRDNATGVTSKSKFRKFIRLTIVFLLGIVIGSIPSIVVYIRSSHTGFNPSIPSGWNIDDYQSNSDYYNEFTEVYDFNQTHNLRLDRLSSPQFHPQHGKSVIYLRKQYHMPDLNESTTTLHWTCLQTNQTKQLTQPIWGVHDQQFYWVDDTTILFLSNRKSDLIQLFQINLPDDIISLTKFIEPIQITDYPLTIDNLLVNRQATRLAFSCQVYANLSIEETYNRTKTEGLSSELVYKFDKLFIRQWDKFMTGRRHHPFLVSIQRNPKGIFEFISTPKDILFGIDSDSPTRPFGEGKTQWSFSSTGNLFAYTRQHDETSEVAWSINLDIYTIDLTLSNYISKCITCDNLATDTDPSYSPIDENILIYRSQSVPAYEFDQYKIKLFNYSSNSKITLLKDWDRSIQHITWTNDGQSLFLELGEEARNVIYTFTSITSNSSLPIRLSMNGTSNSINIHPVNNNMFVYVHESIVEPSNIYLYSSSISIRSITDHNKNLLSKVRMSYLPEKFSFMGVKNETVWGWHIPPANGTHEKAPLAFLIHGGPQSSWYDAWSYRWNYQAFASQGYAVIAINFHGSDSYGQNFTDSITGQYGTLPFEDLQLGLTAALKQFNYIDEHRAIALGASYGGYMINWIAGHPQMSQRFKALVNHDGVFDMKAMAYSTDDLAFIEHCLGNVTQYDNPEAYEKYNPVNYVANWTQPMLVIHGGYDYRVPDTQGISTFTALQRRGIPSRLLYFPKENHWTMNSINSLVWYREVLDWMSRWTK